MAAPADVRAIQRFLRSRGWRRWLGSWWYKPLPGWERHGGPAQSQRLYGTGSAFEEERLRVWGQEPGERRAPTKPTNVASDSPGPRAG